MEKLKAEIDWLEVLIWQERMADTVNFDKWDKLERELRQKQAELKKMEGV